MDDAVTHRGVEAHAVELPGTDAPVRARLYRGTDAPERALVWVHGGAFAWGGLDMPEAHGVSGWFAARGYEVLSVDYRLAPEPDPATLTIGTGGHPFPAAHHDMIAAFDWMVDHAAELGIDHVAIGGASAGGNISAGAAVALRDRGTATPAALVLAYPLLHPEMPPAGPEAAEALARTPREHRFPTEITRLFNLNYVGGDESLLADPRAFAGVGDVADLPPTVIVNSEHDDLRASGEAFAAQLAAAGVPASCSIEPGTFHGHLNAPDQPHAERTLSTLHSWLTGTLAG